ncbi:PoNi-like cognate immunity protein [Vibrio spartinae]|uniref:DUF1911 domain-containing protein n=1 Tax=Vibrio spartinae TaxID=1918945 RepID=A0A1N6MB09_9VIBR|nr:PoNi-like cognate immunity protein [Vibrio spartinae]QMV14193.1 hypothetical protein Vspart_01445 [Vibrio spartinae]SIO96530.1 hypothetical protein VSP9026_04333 [Vibrio spartinae]
MTMDVTDFELSRRDPLLSGDVYNEQRDFFQDDKSNRYDKVNDSTNSIALRSRVSWSLSLGKFEYATLEYSAGSSLEEAEILIRDALAELNRHKTQFPFKSFSYWEPDSFQFLLWSLSFAIFSGEKKSLATIIRMLSKNPQDDDDPLLSILLARLGYIGLPRITYLVFPKSYQHLYDAIKGDGISPTKTERQESIKQYLKGWYKGMKDCYWYNRHKGQFPTFFGYWAFEAGLVTLLYGLDDSSYRHMLYYPKDLVDHARAQGYDQLFAPELMEQQKHYIVLPGDECSIDGTFLCNLTNDQIILNRGDRAPGPIEDENGNRIFWVSQ